MSRTERGFIVFALFLLVFATVEFAVYDYFVSIREHGHKTSAEQSSLRLRRSEVHRKMEFQPLVFTAPKFSVHYSHSDSEELEFSWRYINQEAGGPFTFQISTDPNFKTIWISREIAEAKIALALHFPKIVYYRVTDGQGHYSEIRRLSLLQPAAPPIDFASSAHRQSNLNLKLTPESRATVQIAKDPYFQKVFVTRSGIESNYGFDLPTGKYLPAHVLSTGNSTATSRRWCRPGPKPRPFPSLKCRTF